jgi:two-component system sensor histidine kinase UhpB
MAGIGIHCALLLACALLALQPTWMAGFSPGWLVALALCATLLQWRLWHTLRVDRAQVESVEQELRHSQDQLHQIIKTLPIPLFIKDPQSRLLMMNPACEQQWGMKFEELEGTRAAEHFPPEQMAKFLADDQAVFAHGQLLVVEELAWNAALGENRILETRKNPVFDAGGQPAYLLGISVDVTERRQAQDRLQSTLHQVRQLGEHLQTATEDERRKVAAGIHDGLGQNLLALRIDVALLERRTSGSHVRLHRRVQNAIGTLDATIASVRDIINSVRPGILDLGLDAALEWQLGQFQRHHGISCKLEVQGTLAPVDARLTAAVFRIVQESLDNVARHAQAARVDVALAATPEGLSLSIIDNGVGMEEKAEGAGFGLRAIRERVDALGGELRINSGYGGGTALSIQIPQPALAETNSDQ